MEQISSWALNWGKTGLHWDTLRCRVHLDAAAALCFRVAVTNCEHLGTQICHGCVRWWWACERSGSETTVCVRGGALPQCAHRLGGKGMCGFLKDGSLQLHLHNRGPEINRHWWRSWDTLQKRMQCGVVPRVEHFPRLMQTAQPVPLPAFAGSLLPLLATLNPTLPCSFPPWSPPLRPIVQPFSGPQSVYQDPSLLVGNPGAAEGSPSSTVSPHESGPRQIRHSQRCYYREESEDCTTQTC